MSITTLDRRHENMLRETALKRGITESQLDTLMTLERFGWILKFVRKGAGGPIAAVFDPEKRCLALIDPDGQLNEPPQAQFRH